MTKKDPKSCWEGDEVCPHLVEIIFSFITMSSDLNCNLSPLSSLSLHVSVPCALFLSLSSISASLFFFFFLHIAGFLCFSSKSVLLIEELQSHLSMFYNLKFQKNIRLKKNFFSLLLSTSRENLQSPHFTSSHLISLCHLIAPLLSSNSIFRVQAMAMEFKISHSPKIAAETAVESWYR